MHTAETVVLNNNAGIKARELLTRAGVGNAAKTVETIIPLSRFSFFEELEDSRSSEFYPELDYTSEFKERILQDVINFRYRKNDYNTGTQLNVANFASLYSLIYFDLRSDKSNLTDDPQQLIFYYRLNEAANAQDYTIYAVVLYEEEIVVDKVGGEIAVV